MEGGHPAEMPGDELEAESEAPWCPGLVRAWAGAPSRERAQRERRDSQGTHKGHQEHRAAEKEDLTVSWEQGKGFQEGRSGRQGQLRSTRPSLRSIHWLGAGSDGTSAQAASGTRRNYPWGRTPAC